jgi:hypothetical protein
MTLGNMRERCLGKPAQNVLAAVCWPCELMTIAAFIESARDLTRNLLPCRRAAGLWCHNCDSPPVLADLSTIWGRREDD